MKLYLTKNQKKSLAITLALFIGLFLMLFLYRFTVQTPVHFLDTGGIAIRLGQNSQGKGTGHEVKPQIKEDIVKPAKQVVSNEVLKPQASKVKQEVVKTKVATQSITKAPVVKTSDKATSKVTKTTDTSSKAKQVSSQASNSLANLLAGGNTSNSSKDSGVGDDNIAGNKGDVNGSPYSNSYYGSGGNTGKKWGLNGRSLSGYTPYKQTCNEEGRVVVRVEVNQNGVVTQAKLHLKGTTNTAECLVKPAIETAKSYRWNSDGKAPKSQIGFVVINFKLG